VAAPGVRNLLAAGAQRQFLGSHADVNHRLMRRMFRLRNFIPEADVSVGSPLLKRHEVDVLAARMMALWCSGIVLAALVTVSLFEGIDSSTRSVMQVTLALLGLLLLAGYRSVLPLHPKLITFVILLGGLACNAGLSVVMQVGVHGASMGVMSLLIALAGVLIGVRAALALAAVSVLAVLGLYALELRGSIGGRAAAAALPVINRVYTLVVLMGVGMAAAVVLSRMYLRAFDHATAQGERLAALLRVGADWVWEQDAQGRITYITESFARRAGVPMQQFIGRNWWDVPGISVPEEGWDVVRATYARAEGLRELVLHTKKKDGGSRVMRFSVEPRHDEQGRLAGWLGVGRDITVQVQGERRREELQQLLEALFRTSSDAIVLFTLPEGRVVMVNQAVTRLLGLQEADCIGRTNRELAVWPDKPDRQRVLQAVMQHGSVANEVARLRHRDGHWVSVTVSASRFEHQQRQYMVAAVRDQSLAERQRAEASIVFDNASIGIALVRNYLLVRVNPMFERMLGRAPGSLTGVHVRVAMQDEAVYAQLLAVSEPALKAQQIFEGDIALPRGDAGERFMAHVRGQLLDPTGASGAGVLWLVEDITERHRAQQELAAALDAAESANRAKSAFLATMSHEMRTPLNGTLGMIRLALDSPRDDPQREQFLQHASASAATLAGIIDDVLDLTRIEAGRLQLEEEDYALQALVDTVVQAQGPAARAKGLSLQVSVSPTLPGRLRGDALRVRQLLVNFLGNAIKFTDAGGVQLRLLRREDWLRIEVQDSGPGIPAQTQARLFRPFEQEDASTTRRYGGTGLGLSICRELALLMGGNVGVDSTLGHGSLFWAELPLVVASAAALPGLAAASSSLPLAGMKVLVVEDNPVNMLIACEMLRRWGAQAHEAVDGREALLRLQPGHGFAAVLMDMHMPQMNGVQTTQALRLQPHNQGLRIIALTAAALLSEQQQALAAGMDEFVAKPIDAALLLAALQRARGLA
jgi:PAS domain S-box-containing protein